MDTESGVLNLSDIVSKLEDHVFVTNTHQQPIIHLERNDRLKGIQHINIIYEAIQNQAAISICYQSFKAISAQEIIFHPWWLKEYKNRWFVFGIKDSREVILNLALDRISNISYPKVVKYIASHISSIDDYFKNIIGVTVSQNARPENVKIRVDKENAPYVITKPIHHSQDVIETLEEGSIVISIHVQLNFELEREILGFGDSMVVLSPEKLRKRIISKTTNMAKLYQNSKSY
ncbi:MAG: WYL domain-containing protein [Saprospiraceae bacterium]